MCGIAGAIDLNWSARVFREPAAGDDRRDRTSRARRRADSISNRGSRWGLGGCRSSTWRGAGSRSPTRTARSGSRRTARSLSIPSCDASCCPRPSAGDALRHRAVGPPLRRPGRRFFRKGPRPVCRGGLGSQESNRSSSAATASGICPLYYTEADGWLLWGSEIKALLGFGFGGRPARPARESTCSLIPSAPARPARFSRASNRSHPAISCGFVTVESSDSTLLGP